VKGYSHQPYFDDRRAGFMDRFAQFAVIAAREAVEDAAVEWTQELRETAAIITGSCVGGQSTEDIGFHRVYKLGHNRAHPLTIPKTMANAGASHISMEFGLAGPSYTISTACSSAGHAIGQAFWMVRTGATDLALTGGSEAPFSFGILKAGPANDPTETAAIRAGFWRARGEAVGQLDQVDARARPGSGPRAGVPRHGIGPARRGAASHGEFQRARSALRSGRDSQTGAMRAGGIRHFEFVRLRGIERGAGAA